MNNKCREILAELGKNQDITYWEQYTFPTPFPLELKLKDILEEEVDQKYFLSEEMMKKFTPGNKNLNPEYKSQANAIHDAEKVSPTLCAANHGYAQGYIELKQIGNIDTKGHNSLWGRVYSTDGIAPNLNANGGGAGAKTGLFKIKAGTKKGFKEIGEGDTINLAFVNNPNSRSTCRTDGLVNTLDTACNQAVIKDFRIRRLTPKECFRLQGVKDEDIDLVVSDTQAYKIAGNAISVNVMQELIKALYKTKVTEKVSLFDFM